MEPTTRELNQSFIERVTSDDPELIKEAQNDINEFTRMRMREDGFYRRILPPQNVTNADLSRAVDSPMPVVIVDREPDSPAAVSIPFATLPANWYITGDRYRIDFARIVSPRFTVDVDEIRTYTMDIRAVLSANSLKDMLAEEDGRFINLCNTVLLGQNVVNPVAGQAMWQTIPGGITRATVNDAMKILNRTPARLNTATILANQVFAKDLQKWMRNEVGGDLSQEILINGFAERNLFGVRWLFTIKRNLVPDNTIFMFAEPKYLGKSLILEDVVLHLKKEAYFLWWFAYETLGGAIGNTLGVARVDFTP